jgi:hypothetical protein
MGGSASDGEPKVEREEGLYIIHGGRARDRRVGDSTFTTKQPNNVTFGLYNPRLFRLFPFVPHQPQRLLLVV